MDGGIVHRGFDALRAVVGPGAGVVARLPGLVCVAAPSAPASLRTLLDLCAKASGDAPGLPLGRSLARWLAGPDAPSDDLVFGTVAAAGDRWAVFLSGAVTVHAAGQTLSGADSAAWTDRLIARTDAPVLVSLDGAEAPPDDLSDLFDLQAGVVPGATVALRPAGPAVAPPARSVERPSAAGRPVPPGGVPPHTAAERARHSAQAPPPAQPAQPPQHVGDPAPPTPRSPRRSAQILGHDGPVEVRRPLGEGAAGAPETTTRPSGKHGRVADETTARPSLAAEIAAEHADGEHRHAHDPMARGYLCSRGHLNDPRSHFCVLCGIRMNERTGVLTIGPRPPLGLLVFDDGSTYTVDAEYLLGRTPEADERVRDGGLRALLLDDRGGTVSRVHAEIRVRDWDVVLVDSGARNGTFVMPPDGLTWEQLPTHQSHRLVPGTRVRLGQQRSFVFESPSGVR